MRIGALIFSFPQLGHQFGDARFGEGIRSIDRQQRVGAARDLHGRRDHAARVDQLALGIFMPALAALLDLDHGITLTVHFQRAALRAGDADQLGDFFLVHIRLPFGHIHAQLTGFGNLVVGALRD